MKIKSSLNNLILFSLVGLSFVTFSSFSSKPKDKCKHGNSTTTAPAPRLTSITIIDRNGFSETITNVERIKMYEGINFVSPQSYKKVLRVYERDQNAEIHSYIHSYHENGQPKQYLEVVSGRASGNYSEWHENGTLSLSTTVIGGVADLTPAAQQTWIFDGLCKAWDENGALTAEIPYAKGALDGCSLYYHSNGQIWKRIPYRENKIEGFHETFLENGETLQKAQYVNGDRHGSLIRYWDPKKTAAEEEWVKDRLITGRYYDIQGNLVSQVDQGSGYRALFGRSTISELQEYKQGYQEGEVKSFSKSGQLIKLSHIKNDLRHGEEIEYVLGKDPLQPKMSTKWYEGSLQGVVRTWYDNGNLESQRDHSNNIKNGLATAWYRDGSLMMIEEYELDKLVKGQYFKKGTKYPVSTINNGKGTATLFDAEGSFVKKVTYQNSKPVL